MTTKVRYCPMLFLLLSTNCAGGFTPRNLRDANATANGDSHSDSPNTNSDSSSKVDFIKDIENDEEGLPKCSDRESYFKGYCYTATGLGGMPYQIAKETCVGLGSNPVSIHSEEENAFVYSLLFGMTEYAWIGLKEGKWEDSNEAPTYTNWASGQHSNECTVMRGPLYNNKKERGMWEDRACNLNKREVVCKRAALPE